MFLAAVLIMVGALGYLIGGARGLAWAIVLCALVSGLFLVAYYFDLL
jgi:hypothetical protein